MSNRNYSRIICEYFTFFFNEKPPPTLVYVWINNQQICKFSKSPKFLDKYISLLNIKLVFIDETIFAY